MTLDKNAFEANRGEQIEKFLRDLTERMAEQPTLVVIGGFAVRAHGAKRFSHDADVMVDYRTYGELRDQYTLHRNPRLGKEQFTADGIETDVYVENLHKLTVPFDEIQAYAQRKNGIWIACEEHLLVLKLDALKERRHSDKGDKDIEDIFVLLTRTKLEQQAILKDHMTSEDWEMLSDVVGTPGNWQKYTNNNHKEAAELQKMAQATLNRLQDSGMGMK